MPKLKEIIQEVNNTTTQEYKDKIEKEEERLKREKEEAERIESVKKLKSKRHFYASIEILIKFIIALIISAIVITTTILIYHALINSYKDTQLKLREITQNQILTTEEEVNNFLSNANINDIAIIEGIIESKETFYFEDIPVARIEKKEDSYYDVIKSASMYKILGLDVASSYINCDDTKSIKIIEKDDYIYKIIPNKFKTQVAIQKTKTGYTIIDVSNEIKGASDKEIAEASMEFKIFSILVMIIIIMLIAAFIELNMY